MKKNISDIFIYDNKNCVTLKAHFKVFDISQAVACLAFIEQNTRSKYVSSLDKKRIISAIISGFVSGFVLNEKIISLALCEIAGEDTVSQLYGIKNVFYDTAIISFVATDTDFRGQGIAKHLVFAVLQTPLFLFSPGALSFCHPKNLAAVRLLHTVAFLRIVGVRLINGRLQYIFLKKAKDQHLFCDFLRINASNVYEISKNVSKGFVSVSTFTENATTYLWLAR